MPKLTIDNIEVEVPAGTTVLEAAKRMGIWIPHFCYHPALGSVGACRVCAVKCLDGPVKGIQMSCMLPAQGGMVVSTTDADARAMRRNVIEWLMLNHPHDCPVCDEGGECLLQDYTIAGGHGIRRYGGKKRTHVNQYLGPHIEHEMNRCIQCYRCARFYQEYAGGRDFGVMGSARRVYFGRFVEGELESSFAGNLVDICPTGVFTDKTARFRARYWDYDLAPSVCPHCSLGCNTVPAARYRELLKTMARPNDAVNGHFICDRGRFANGAVNDPERPRVPLVDGQETGWDEALDALVLRLGELLDLHGEGSVAVVGSSRLALEGSVLLPILAACADAGVLSYFADAGEGDRVAAAVSLLTEENAASQADVRSADAVVIMACDLLAEGPMLALAVRQAWRKGARLFMVGSDYGEGVAKALDVEVTPLEALADVPFDRFQQPVVICGTATAEMATIEAAAAAGTKLTYTLPGPNAFAATLLSREHGAGSLAEGVATGRVKGIIALEGDIPEELLASVPFVVAADWLPTVAVRKAQIVLPTTAWVEMDGTFVNNEGRAQRFRRTMHAGLPIKGLPERYHASAHKPAPFHPPRVHRSTPPGGEALPAWRVIAALIERLGGEKVEEPLSGRWEGLRNLDPEGEGVRVM
ncbi:NADH-quinone oxidoreductase subunit NuoG [Geomobilimonas luticola]|uniref:NADH-quinone oxidoreductase subunit NuoG n=1 Tax=Geomobilimonas luticola TaxID=1114878 RepID=A0ABS5SAI6_9BACT|nr:NADH-quinone oxidoreductase subunit NuoG [Geomobilimonas luticola]MBT0651616.1 NADH-quinone oxidoreductase subunit NuoG [Geomobilimonas luticola]